MDIGFPVIRAEERHLTGVPGHRAGELRSLFLLPQSAHRAWPA